jgi:chaperonin GroEL
MGVQIIRKALEAPLWMIAENGGKEGAVIVDEVRSSKDPNYGYDGATDTYGDMLKKGIIDPAKVTRTALENAASIASLVLTTEAIVTEIPEAPGAAPAMPGGMPPGMEY